MHPAKFVLTADVHIHPYRICSNDGGHDRLLDGLSALRQGLLIAREEQAVWIMAGDFKQPKTFWPQQALTGAHEILREFPDVRKYMLAGNHDAKGVGGCGLAPFQDVANIIDEQCVIDDPALGPLHFVPWDAVPEPPDVMCTVIAHAFLAGVVLGPEDIRVNKGVDLSSYGDFACAFFGDIHKGQWFAERNGRPASWEGYKVPENYPLHKMYAKAPVYIVQVRKETKEWRREVFYPGSPYMQNWGERNDGVKGVLLVDLDKGTVDLRAIKAPRFVHLEVNEGELELLLSHMDALAGDFVRVVYLGDHSMILGSLVHKAPTFRHFQLIRRRDVPNTKRVEVHAGMDRAELLERYLTARPPVEDKDKTRQAGQVFFLGGQS